MLTGSNFKYLGIGIFAIVVMVVLNQMNQKIMDELDDSITTAETIPASVIPSPPPKIEKPERINMVSPPTPVIPVAEKIVEEVPEEDKKSKRVVYELPVNTPVLPQ